MKCNGGVTLVSAQCRPLSDCYSELPFRRATTWHDVADMTVWHICTLWVCSCDLPPHCPTTCDHMADRMMWQPSNESSARPFNCFTCKITRLHWHVPWCAVSRPKFWAWCGGHANMRHLDKSVRHYIIIRARPIFHTYNYLTWCQYGWHEDDSKAWPFNALPALPIFPQSLTLLLTLALIHCVISQLLYMMWFTWWCARLAWPSRKNSRMP